MTSSRLAGRVVVVTGGARGIGLAIARAAAASGARVVVLDVRPPSGDTGAAEVEWRPLDVTNTPTAARLFAALRAERGPIDVLVNNAGVLLTTPLESASAADWQRVISVNLEAVFFLTQAALPHLANASVVVNVASTSAFVAGGDQSVYEISKAGVVMLTRSLAVELGPRGVRVNAVAPGLIDTPMTRRLFDDDSRFEARVQEKVPMGRAGLPEDIAEAVVFLASADAAYMTGETLVVDGGWLLS
jgi:NAD(P)-dependent dehydrogenase (short-subunit alcohol dehydrogenase family)